MAGAGVLGRVAPGADPRAVAPLVAAEAGRPPAWERRLVAMGGDEVAQRWRLSRAEVRGLAVRREALEAGTPAVEVAWRHGVDAALDVALVQMALRAPDHSGRTLLERRLKEALERGLAPQEAESLEASTRHELCHDGLGQAAARGGVVAERLDDALAHATAAAFPLRAADLMPALSGPALGAALKKAEAAWIASGFALSRDELRRMVLGA